MRALVAAGLVAIAACASTHAPPPATPCRTVALPWPPRALPKAPVADRKHPCARHGDTRSQLLAAAHTLAARATR